MRRRLSIRSVYRRVAAVYRSEWRNLLLAAAVLFLPLAPLEALSIDLNIDTTAFDAPAVLATLGTVVAVALTVTLGTLAYSAFAERLFTDWHAGREPPHAWDVVRSLPIVRLVVLDALLSVGIAVGLVLLVLPGVLVFGWFSLSAVVMTSEDLGIRASLRRSRELVRGNFVRVVIALALPVLFKAVANSLIDAVDVAVIGQGFAGACLTSYLSSLVAMPVIALALVSVVHELARPAPARDA